jgi:riboflavin-specific deaminase-like protein
MPTRAAAASIEQRGSSADAAWPLLRAAGALATDLERDGVRRVFGLDARGELRQVSLDAQDAVLEWQPALGWTCRLPSDDPRFELIDLYLPICSATPDRPITVGHLGQSLDGFIATPSGDSQYVTGDDNLVHVHRMRALCDAVVVGAGTVAADDPQLTTRHVSGGNPLRVVIDRGRRLEPVFKVFTDQQAPTLYVCAHAQVAPDESHIGDAAIATIDDTGPVEAAGQVMQLLRARGCARVLVEGGGVTVSAFLEAGLLDRLQIAVAPLIIGDGRPAIRLAPQDRLRDCLRPSYRVYRMGGDVLFDCDLHAVAEPAEAVADDAVRRVI